LHRLPRHSGGNVGLDIRAAASTSTFGRRPASTVDQTHEVEAEETDTVEQCQPAEHLRNRSLQVPAGVQLGLRCSGMESQRSSAMNSLRCS
jgi:hypothetical protein